jgi:hypothetical protein
MLRLGWMGVRKTIGRVWTWPRGQWAFLDVRQLFNLPGVEAKLSGPKEIA